MKELLYNNTRTYLISDKLLIDTDVSGTLPLFFRKLKELGISAKSISHIMFTHFHPDHMGIAADLADLGIRPVIFDVQLPYVHFSDSIYAKDRHSPYKPIDESRAIILSCDESRAFLKGLGIYGEVLHTKGHSEDSVSLLLDDGTAFVGDLYPYSSLPVTDEKETQRSYKTLIAHGAKRFNYGHMLSE